MPPWNAPEQDSVQKVVGLGAGHGSPPARPSWTADVIALLVFGGPIVSGLVIFTTWAIHAILS